MPPGSGEYDAYVNGRIECRVWTRCMGEIYRATSRVSRHILAYWLDIPGMSTAFSLDFTQDCRAWRQHG